jgi:hypothetical protein
MAHSTLNIVSFILLFSFIGANSFAQKKPDRNIDMKEIVVKSDKIEKRKFKFKKVGLYDSEEAEEYNIRGYNQLLIFEEALTDEFWMSSEGTDCISGNIKNDEESSYLSLEWNEMKEDCAWVGFGFGWSSWLGKDLLYVADTLAIELMIRSTGEDLSNLPWAFGIEDYAGEQAWLGYNKKFLRAEKISSEWTKVEMPLPYFPFDENEVNLRNVKQLLIQVFATGIIEIKSIRLVPFSRQLKKQASTSSNDLAISIDGNLDDWAATSFDTLEGAHEFAVHYTEDSLFFAFNIKDETPMENTHQKGDLWQGDAIEIAFSTNPSADPKRNYLLFSDKHLGLNCSNENPYLWSWTEDKAVTSADFKFKKTANGYIAEVGIPLASLSASTFKKGDKLGFEIAIDLNKEKIRKEQIRWNSNHEEGFNLSPQKWGELILK